MLCFLVIKEVIIKRFLLSSRRDTGLLNHIETMKDYGDFFPCGTKFLLHLDMARNLWRPQSEMRQSE